MIVSTDKSRPGRKGGSAAGKPADDPALPLALGQALIDAVVDAVAARIEARPAQRLLTVDDAAVYLGRTASAVREMLRSAKLPAVKIDGRVMFDRYDLDALIDRSKAG